MGAGYRYAFNGKEKDDETYGEGDEYDFGARIYDPRLGRWMSVDPKENKFPFQSPYMSLGNNPIVFLDPDGRAIVPSVDFLSSDYNRIYYLTCDNTIVQKYSAIFLSTTTQHDLNLDYGRYATNESIAFYAEVDDNGKEYAETVVAATFVDNGARPKDAPVVMNGSSSAMFGVKDWTYRNGKNQITNVVRSDISLFEVYLHETIHGFLGVSKTDLKGLGQHEYMARYLRHDIVAGLKEFANANGLTKLKEEDFEILSWAGLTNLKTNDFDNWLKEKKMTRGEYNEKLNSLEQAEVIRKRTGEINTYDNFKDHPGVINK